MHPGCGWAVQCRWEKQPSELPAELENTRIDRSIVRRWTLQWWGLAQGAWQLL